MTTTDAAPHPISSPVSQPQANKRGLRDFKKARDHSRWVFLLKFLFPVAACAIVFIFVASALFSYSPLSDLSVDNTGLKDGKLVMEQPKMAGFDKNERPYDVKASKAIQDLTKPDKIDLEKIDARLPMDANSFADVDADTGTYDTTNETLILRDNVKIKGARGMDITLQDADIDMKTGTMKSNNPVQVQSKDTNISADSVAVEDNGKRILFKKRVKMTIIRPTKRGESPPSTEQ